MLCDGWPGAARRSIRRWFSGWSPAPDGGPINALTPRERDVLALMAEGRSNGAIAARLVVTVGAIENHVTAIFDKLGLRPEPEDHRRVLAVLKYLKY